MSIIKSAKVVVLNIIIFGMFFFMLELLFAYTNPLKELPQNGFVNGELYTWGHKVRVNKFGFRDSAVVTPKPNDEFRIIVLGDSLTWGAGLSESQRYTNITENLLQKEFPNKKIEILNFGISGGPMIAHYQNLKQLKTFIEADLIVVGFCLNDPQHRSQDYSVEREKYSNKLSMIFKVLESMHRLAPNLSDKINKSIWVSLERIKLVPSWYEALDRAYDKSSNEWMLFENALKGIYQISNELELPPPIFLILNQGSSTVEPTDYKNPDPVLRKFIGWYGQAESEARKIGFITHNHMEEFSNELDKEILGVNILDGHPSYKENVIYAKKLTEIIKERYIN